MGNGSLDFEFLVEIKLGCPLPPQNKKGSNHFFAGLLKRNTFCHPLRQVAFSTRPSSFSRVVAWARCMGSLGEMLDPSPGLLKGEVFRERSAELGARSSESRPRHSMVGVGIDDFPIFACGLVVGIQIHSTAKMFGGGSFYCLIPCPFFSSIVLSRNRSRFAWVYGEFPERSGSLGSEFRTKMEGSPGFFLLFLQAASPCAAASCSSRCPSRSSARASRRPTTWPCPGGGTDRVPTAPTAEPRGEDQVARAPCEKMYPRSPSDRCPFTTFLFWLGGEPPKIDEKGKGW